MVPSKPTTQERESEMTCKEFRKVVDGSFLETTRAERCAIVEHRKVCRTCDEYLTNISLESIKGLKERLPSPLYELAVLALWGAANTIRKQDVEDPET